MVSDDLEPRPPHELVRRGRIRHSETELLRLQDPWDERAYLEARHAELAARADNHPRLFDADLDDRDHRIASAQER